MSSNTPFIMFILRDCYKMCLTTTTSWCFYTRHDFWATRYDAVHGIEFPLGHHDIKFVIDKQGNWTRATLGTSQIIWCCAVSDTERSLSHLANRSIGCYAILWAVTMVICRNNPGNNFTYYAFVIVWYIAITPGVMGVGLGPSAKSVGGTRVVGY